MWFAFGLITLIGFAVYTYFTRAAAGWKAQRATHEGRSYQWRVDTHKKVSTTRIGVDAPADFDFRVREETGRDRWFLRTGISAEMRLGDALLDRRLYVESDDASLAQAFARDAGLRDALLLIVRALQKSPASHFELRAAEGRIWFQLRHWDNVGPQRFVPIVMPFLDDLAHALRRQLPRPPLEQRDPFVVRAALLLGLNTGCVALGFIGLQVYLFGQEPLLQPGGVFATSVPLALLLQAALVWWAWRWLGRSARTHLVLLELLVLGTLGLQGSTLWLAREANMLFDTSAVEYRRYEQVEVERRRSRKRTTYYLELWQESGGQDPSIVVPRRLRINSEIAARLPQTPESHDAASRRVPVRLGLRRGAFGHAWVASIERAPALDGG